MPNKDKRTPREKAADYQIENMRKHFPLTFEFKGDTVTMPVKALRERLGFAYTHGELDMRARIEAALRPDCQIISLKETPCPPNN